MSKNNKQDQIIDLLIEQCEAKMGTKIGPHFSSEGLRKSIFTNRVSMRLTYEGFSVLKRFFDYHGFSVCHEIPPGYLLYLDRESNYPWFIGSQEGKQTLFLFDSEMVMELNLRGGKIDNLLRSGQYYGWEKKKLKT